MLFEHLHLQEKLKLQVICFKLATIGYKSTVCSRKILLLQVFIEHVAMATVSKFQLQL